MRLVVQRVEIAKVLHQGLDKSWQIIGEIDNGLLILIGVRRGDTEKDAESLVEKIFKLRVMSDDFGKMNLSVKDVCGKILVVSQFTLHADTKDGNRPSFVNAEEPKRASQLYKFFVEKLREKGIDVETGSFGDYMKIDAILDGPVTIIYSD